jgi:hypothetical protein
MHGTFILASTAASHLQSITGAKISDSKNPPFYGYRQLRGIFNENATTKGFLQEQLL